MVRFPSMRSVAFVAVTACFAFALGAAGLACGSSSSSPTPDAAVDEAGPVPMPDAGAPDADPYPFNQVCKSVEEADLCRKCAVERCCDTREAIFATDAGGELVSCNAVAGCGEACSAACFGRFPPQVKPYLDHFTCMAHRCLNECASPVSACSACIDANCALDGLACNMSADCYLLSSCSAACPRGEQTCLEGCAARYPAAAQLQTNLVVCGRNRCPSECASGVP